MKYVCLVFGVVINILTGPCLCNTEEMVFTTAGASSFIFQTETSDPQSGRAAVIKGWNKWDPIGAVNPHLKDIKTSYCDNLEYGCQPLCMCVPKPQTAPSRSCSSITTCSAHLCLNISHLPDTFASSIHCTQWNWLTSFESEILKVHWTFPSRFISVDQFWL